MMQSQAMSGAETCKRVCSAIRDKCRGGIEAANNPALAHAHTFSQLGSVGMHCKAGS